MIDVIVPNYNGSALLPTCLDSLRAQTRRDFVVTVVDDASTDDSVTLLRSRYPEAQVLVMPHNRGFAAAVNAALAATQRPFVALLNNDTEADPRWLEALIGALERWPQFAFAASKLRLFDRRDVLHSAGDFYRINGEPGNRGVWEFDRGQYDAYVEVFGPCAGAAAYRRNALDLLAEDGNVFDEELVMYCEDVDLNLRARRKGLRTIFVPTAVVYHRLSASGGGVLASYYCGRNFPLVWAKNMPAPLARRHWPDLLVSQARFAMHSLLHIREPAARARLRGQLAGLRALPRFLARRSAEPEESAMVTAALALGQPPVQR
ncbi:glycosyltransferase family 2 protein [Chloroflexus sp.]|uniref:glycosyltransferase family 2 protein n=1 Tax=Chloroflexus sp. TaxID=1904827 RepID=UPI00262F99CC|nr:glycosyltransferase family 2 protein [uncultured Chloroflexus sp.]